MVRHIVFMKFPDFSLAQIAKKKLLSMKEHIDVLQDIEAGIDFSRSERSYDLALVTTFASKKDLETYRIHPYHQEIVQWLKVNDTQTKVVHKFKNMWHSLKGDRECKLDIHCQGSKDTKE